jgi:hypothetical protein
VETTILASVTTWPFKAAGKEMTRPPEGSWRPGVRGTSAVEAMFPILRYEFLNRYETPAARNACVIDLGKCRPLFCQPDGFFLEREGQLNGPAIRQSSPCLL